MRAYPLRGPGLSPGMRKFFWGPVKWHRADGRVPFWAQKTRDFQGPTPPTCLSNGYARIQNIMYIVGFLSGIFSPDRDDF